MFNRLSPESNGHISRQPFNLEHLSLSVKASTSTSRVRYGSTAEPRKAKNRFDIARAP